MNMDYIRLDNFRVRATHGHSPEERHVEQEFEVSLAVGCDMRRAGKSDKLPDTIDFDFLRRVVEETLAGKKRYLVEALAEEIAQKILADSRAREVSVTIKKPSVWPDAVPGITITRVRP